jgi:hypothetical protein
MAELQVGKPVTGDQLIGRENEISAILELLNQGQSIVLIAPRRFGKTSVILELLSRVKNNSRYTAFVDIFTTPDLPALSQKITEQVLNNNQLGNVFRKIKNNITELIRNIEFKQTIESFEFILKFTKTDTDNWELLSESLDFINAYAGKNNKKIICAFDEFGDIGKFDGDRIVKMVRSKTQLHDNAVYIFSGSYESVMDTLFVHPNSPFYRFARIINLGYIGHKDFKNYLIQKLDSEKIHTDEKLCDEILTFTKGHPYYTQLILQYILINHKAGMDIGSLSMTKILQQVTVIENNYLEKQWEEISKSRELVQTLLAVVQHKQSLYSVVDTKKVNLGRALKKLTGNGTLYYDDNGYYMSDPLFEYWIKENVIMN